MDETVDNADLQEGLKCHDSNYRIVSLTCVISRLLKRIICCQIRDYIDTHIIMTWFRHGSMVAESPK